MLDNIFKRVSVWNAQRYEREYNHDLSCSLLDEEHLEWLEAEEDVDKLDALCDQIYVAMGVLWKLNLEDGTSGHNANLAYKDWTKLTLSNTLMPGYLVSSVLNAVRHDNEYPVAFGMHMVIGLCTAQMSAMGLSTPEVVQALSIVCDANDSKPAAKFASDVKATKGDSFEPPEKLLQELLNNAKIL